MVRPFKVASLPPGSEIHRAHGLKFTVHTDQRSLKFLLLQQMVNPNYQNWLYKLLGYDFDIEYKPRFHNKVPDALSRVPTQSTLLSLSVPHLLHFTALDQELANDPSLSQLRETLS